MGVGDTPSMKRLREQVRGIDTVLAVGGALGLVGLGSPRLAETRQELVEINAQMGQMVTYPDRLDEYFAEK